MRCEKAGKVIHTTQEHAEKHIRSMKRAGSISPDWNAYPCDGRLSVEGAPILPHWHIGHNPKLLQKRITAALQVGNAKTNYQKRKRR